MDSGSIDRKRWTWLLGPLRWRVVLGYAAFAVAVFLLSLPIDGPAYRLFEATHTSDTWWHRGLKALGWAPLWLTVAAVLLIIDATRHKTLGWKNVLARPALLAFACGLGGLIAEMLKLLLRRLRPGVADGEYLLRPFTVDPLTSNNLGLPSSHAMVAFAACMMAGRLWPKLAPVFWLLAAVCAWPVVAMLWWWNRREVERHHLVPWPPPLRRELQREAEPDRIKPKIDAEERE